MNLFSKEQFTYRLCILFISTIFFLPSTFAQEIKIDQQIKLSKNKLTVEQVLVELHQNYAINFSYNDKNLPLEKILFFKETSLSLSKVLNVLSDVAQIDYKIYNDLIILTAQVARKMYTISGYVEDDVTGEKLFGANIYNGLDYSGTTSNMYGFYSLTLPQGQVNLNASYVGYQRKEQDFILTSDTTIHFKLTPMLEIDEVEIEGIRREHKTLSKLSVIKISSKEVEKIPALFGEVDVLKSLQLLPGVQSGTEGSSGLVVRGGGTDQNLIILDGVPVYNVNHLLGFFSVFNSNAINDVSLYKSGFPARYGGRASSVIDINMKEGNNKQLRGEGSIGLISSRFTLEGPIKNENTAFILSGRRTYLDIIGKPFLTKKEGNQTRSYGYYFYDLNMKINHRFSDKSRLFLSSYLGNDVFHSDMKMKDEDEKAEFFDELKWGNITTNLRWNYILNNKLFANTTLSYSNYRFLFIDEVELKKQVNNEEEVIGQSTNFLNGIYDMSAKIDFDYFPNPNHVVKFGVGYFNHSFVPSSYTQKNTPGRDTSYREHIYGNETFLYLEDNISIGKKASVNTGAHYSFFQSGKKNYSHLQPRISVKYSPWKNFAFKASYSKMVQYLQTNSYSTVSLPIDLWVPSTDSLKPVESNNYSLGADYQYTNKYSIGVEGFYKDMKNVIAFKEGVAPNANFLGDIVQGKGWAYGVEFMVKKNVGKTTGWLSYTWSNSWRKFDEISFNEKFPYKYDRRHDISLVAMHKFSDRVDVSGSWVFGTGIAMSLSTEKYISNFALEAYGEEEVSRRPHIEIYGSRNNYRMPNYHRMDIGVNFHKEKKRITRTWSFGAYNVYNRRNALWIFWDDSGRISNEKGLYQISLFQIIPYFSYSFKF